MSSRQDEAALSPFGIIGALLVDYNEVLRFFIRVMYQSSTSTLPLLPADLDSFDTSKLLGEILGLNRDTFCGPPSETNRLGPSETNGLHEIRRVRNDWAHQNPILEPTALRALESMLLTGEAIVRIGKAQPQPRASASLSAEALTKALSSLRKIAYHRDLMVILLAEKTLAENAVLASRLYPADFPTLSRFFGGRPLRSSSGFDSLSDSPLFCDDD